MNHDQAPKTGNVDAVLLLGPTGQSSATEAAYQMLIPPLAERLSLPLQACRLAFRELPALEALDAFIAAACHRIVVLRLALQQEEHQHEAIFSDLDWLSARSPQLELRYATTIAAQGGLIDALSDRVAACLPTHDSTLLRETAILLLSRGSNIPEINAEVARLARLLWEGRPYGWVEAACYQHTQPGISAGLDRCRRLGARQIVVAPYWFYLGTSQRHIAAQLAAFQAEHPSVVVTLAETLANHPCVIEAIAQQVMRTAVVQTQRQHAHTHSDSQAHQLTGLSFLPPRYRNGAAVSAAPMAAAPLVYDAEGRVAWDKTWGADDPDNPFCALALAGGPPHRSKLLEPVTPAAVQADWNNYARVLAELTRGIHLTTGLRTCLSQTLGWIGVQCHSEMMAIWLLRAIIAENVSVHREGEMLYLPAGPSFRLENEVKNVITTLAKTYHYWQEHLHS